MTNEEAEKVLTDEFKIRAEAYQSYLRAYGKADVLIRLNKSIAILSISRSGVVDR